MDLTLYTKISLLPDHLRAEANDFIDFLLNKSKIKKNTIRKAGFLKGKIKMSPDFDNPLNDFKEYM